MLAVATFWTAVKPEYRSFANAGTGAQVNVQPLPDRLDYLFNALLNFDGVQFADGFDGLLARHSYIDFLGHTLSYVPSSVPHEDGARLGSSIMHILMPRIFFPDKPATPHDTQVTAQYTGLSLGDSPNTSISIGYLGELYVDFGIGGAILATFVLGLCAGTGYRLLRDHRRVPKLITYGVCVMAALPLATFGTALIKLVGSLVMTFAAALVVQRVIAPWAMQRIGLRASRRRMLAAVGR